jgi:hypothetical protein
LKSTPFLKAMKALAAQGTTIRGMAISVRCRECPPILTPLGPDSQGTRPSSEVGGLQNSVDVVLK